MKIDMKFAFVIAVVLHIMVLGAFLIKVSLDKPSRPNVHQGELMHATFIPPAKGSEQGKAQKKTEAPAPEVKNEVKTEVKTEEKKQEMEERLARQKHLEEQRQKALEEQRKLALKKAEEQKKKLEEEKKKAQEAKRKLEEKKKLEEEKKKKLEEEKKKKLEEEQKKKLEEEKKKKLEEEKKKKLEEEQKKKKAEEQRRQDEERKKAEADSLENDILGQKNGEDGGQGLGSSGADAGYGDKIRTLIEQNWRVDQSMNGKKVQVIIKIDKDGMVTSTRCEGDERVCRSALDAIELVGMFPAPPKNCPDCSQIKVSMIPKL
jgi:colicin import membrane protein